MSAFQVFCSFSGRVHILTGLTQNCSFLVVKFSWNHCLWTVATNCNLEELDFWQKLSKHLHSCSGEDGDCGENWFQFSSLLNFCCYQGSCLLCKTFAVHFNQSGWVTVGGRVSLTFGTFRVINLQQETSFLSHDLGKMAQTSKYRATVQLEMSCNAGKVCFWARIAFVRQVNKLSRKLKTDWFWPIKRM